MYGSTLQQYQSRYQAPTTEEFLQSVGSQQSGSTPSSNEVDPLSVATPDNAEVTKLASIKTNSSAKLKELLNTFYNAGKKTYSYNIFHPLYASNYRPKQDSLVGSEYDALPDPKQAIPQVASVFQEMKKLAQSLESQFPHIGTGLSDAVTSSAYWFWENIEKPSIPSSSPEKYASSSAGLEKAKKRNRRSKIIQYSVIGLSVIVGSTMIYYAFFNKPKSKSNPKPKTKRKRLVTKGRVRKRNRKSIPTVRRNSRKPVLPSNTHLSKYRKKYDQSKRKGLRLKR